MRGEFRSIPTALPGVRIGEVLPRTARLLNRVTILRSLTHPHPIHGTAFALTGVPTTDLTLESNPRDPRQWPFVGSVVDYLGDQADPRPPAVPRNFGLPFLLGSKRRTKPGPFGGFLGAAYDTTWSEFRSKGTREVLRDSGAPDVPTRMMADPYLGILPTDRFESVASDATITLDRLNSRASLLDQLDSARRTLGSTTAETSFDRHHAMARSVLTSGKLRDALDVQREPAKQRDRYGMGLFGQSCLAARRLLEAGGKFVTVCWDEYGLVNTGWDTHVHMRSRLKDELGPGLDNAFATLLEDLDARGMLDDTAIVVMSEHGRTPMVQKVSGGGRDHWSRAYSAFFAGAAFAKGRVVGRTDRIAGEVTETPFSPKDVVATSVPCAGHRSARRKFTTASVAPTQLAARDVCEGTSRLRAKSGALWRGNEQVYLDAAGVAKSGTLWAAERGVVAVGADNMAWDVPDERDPESGATLFAPVHLLTQKGTYIIENLNLEESVRLPLRVRLHRHPAEIERSDRVAVAAAGPRLRRMRCVIRGRSARRSGTRAGRRRRLERSPRSSGVSM